MSSRHGQNRAGGIELIERHGTVRWTAVQVTARAVRTRTERRCDAIKEVARATTARGASPVRRALNIAPIMRPPQAADSGPPAPNGWILAERRRCGGPLRIMSGRYV